MESKTQPGSATFTFCVDDVTYEHNRPKATGRELMEIAGVPLEVGVMLINDDGSQRPIDPEEILDLGKGPKAIRKPDLRRGCR